MEEQDTLGDALAREVAEDKAGADGRTELDGEEKEEPSKPATLLWLIQKLARMAKLEAAYTPKNPLKVRQATEVSVVRVFCCCHCDCLLVFDTDLVLEFFSFFFHF